MVKTKRKRAYGFEYFLIYYAWIDEKHQELRAHTAVEALSKLGAMQKFQRENRHVVIVPDGRVSNDPGFLVNLRTRLHELASLPDYTAASLNTQACNAGTKTK